MPTLLDDVRRETAHQLLRDSALTMNHLARQLGYTDQSVLTRSCQRWFAMTPTQCRNEWTIGASRERD